MYELMISMATNLLTVQANTSLIQFSAILLFIPYVNFCVFQFLLEMIFFLKTLILHGCSTNLNLNCHFCLFYSFVSAQMICPCQS